MLRWLTCVLILAAGLVAQQKATTLPLPTAPGFQISGIVVDAVSNSPVTGARVAISPVNQRDKFTTVVTHENGRFLFPGLSAGKYTLTAQHRGYVTQSFNQHDQYASSIAVGPDLDSSNLIFAIVPEGAISGTVTDENGDAVRGAQVMMFQSSNDDGVVHTRLRSTTNTDDEGRYRFSHRQQGKYYIAVFGTPWYAQRPRIRTTTTTYFSDRSTGPLNNTKTVIEEELPSSLDVAYPLTFYGGTTDSSAASPILLGKGEKASADITLQPVPAVTWRMSAPGQDQTRPAFAGLEQKLFDGTPFPLPIGSRPSLPGTWEVTGIPPGHYTASVFTEGNADQAEKQTIEATEDGAVEKAPVTVSPLSATLSFQQPATAQGQITLRLRDTKTNQAFLERINGKGNIEFKAGIPRGTYEVSVFSASDIFIQRVQAAGARMTGRSLEVKGPAPIKLSVVLGQGRAEVSGVALRNDKPVSGVMVVLVPADPVNNRVLFRRDQSNSDGSFYMGYVVPGRYTMLAIADGWDLEWANPAVLAKFLPQGEPLTVESKGKYSVKVKVQ
ncbi:MAG TPA: carboxypeptidase regulatory-like domain-containing protein [Candidatus Angelobacter sp.]|nr:carboxypeptidase regulatory-like domain-containing protein [Candidatus Angelobacter sp.]